MVYSIVVPAYNESVRIRGSLKKILDYIEQQKWNAEVIVVNDGSRDETAGTVREFAAQNPIVRLIENPGNRGKGYSVRNGMLHSSGDILLFSDADLSSPIYEAGKLFAEIERGADVVLGSRWLDPKLQTQRQSLFRQFGGRVINLLMRIILGLKFKDTQCGFKAFSRKAAEIIFPRQHVERWAFDPELLFLARKFHLSAKEVAVEWANDDRSKLNPVVDGAKFVAEMLRIRWNDLAGRYTEPHVPVSERNTAAQTIK